MSANLHLSWRKRQAKRAVSQAVFLKEYNLMFVEAVDGASYVRLGVFPRDRSVQNVNVLLDGRMQSSLSVKHLKLSTTGGRVDEM
jgi:hypothetical protein